MDIENEKPKQNRFRKLLKRFGWAGIIFFTVKGIIMLIAGGAIIAWIKGLFD